MKSAKTVYLCCLREKEFIKKKITLKSNLKGGLI